MEKEYPLLLKRIQALMIDFFLILITMAFLSQLVKLFNGVPDGVRMGAFIALIFLYDPLMTSMVGGTLGHRALGLRVRKESSEEENIHFFAALLRFAVKASLGWISLLTVTGNQRKRAIHDMIGGSVVILRKKTQPFTPSVISGEKG